MERGPNWGYQALHTVCVYLIKDVNGFEISADSTLFQKQIKRQGMENKYA
jgi:hypothetical protein